MRRKFAVSQSLFAFVMVCIFASGLLLANPVTASASSVNPWWPKNGVHVSGLQPFKGEMQGVAVEQYQMYWQVDGGALVTMDSNYTGYPHKEASVNIAPWTWRGAGPYTVTFVAKQNGTVVAQQSITLYNDDYNASTQPKTAAAPQTTVVAAPITLTTQPTVTPTPTANASVQVWWPTTNVSISGTQPFKAVISGMDPSAYTMYWRVDGGALNVMPTNNTGYPHKETSVDVGAWRSNTSGMYTVTFVAKNTGGTVIGQTSVPVKVPTTNTPTIPPTLGTPTIVQNISNVSNPLALVNLWVNPNNPAAAQASAWSSSNPNDAQLMRMLAAQPTAQWFGGWSGDIYSATRNAVTRAQSTDSVPVLIAYNIPARDCGGYSAGGVGSASAYNSWIQSFAAGIGSARAIVILEPDALSGISCLSSADAQTRYTLLANAVTTLKNNANTAVYIDAGHSGWIDTGTMANRLRSANVSHANGFALNVSNFQTTNAETSYGTQISQNLGGKHFVIDTSRNGLGSNGEWCNPQGRALGIKPTTNTGNSLIDAFLWLKVPGESDGNCNGGPGAGTWWPSYALGLAQRAQ